MASDNLLNNFPAGRPITPGPVLLAFTLTHQHHLDLADDCENDGVNSGIPQTKCYTRYECDARLYPARCLDARFGSARIKPIR